MSSDHRTWATPTGRIGDVVPGGGLAIVFDPPWRARPELRAAVTCGRAFLERPMVAGVAPLVDADVAAGRLVYGCGRAVPLGALLADARRRGAPLGARVAAEIGWLAASTLLDAAAAGPLQGVFCHGDVGPWRLAVQPAGGVTLLGYGVPDLAAAPYAPPERRAGGLEDVRSDLFSLALLLVEIAAGEPPCRDGAADARRRLPPPLADALGPLLATRPDRRPDGVVALRGLHEAVRAALPGPGLAEVARRAPDPSVAAPVDRPRRAVPPPPSGAPAARPRRAGAPPDPPVR